MRFVDVKIDYVFRKIFGDVKHTHILIDLLNTILFREGDKQIKEITILNPIQVPHLEELKETILDVNCRSIEGEEFIVEMQTYHSVSLEKRALYYVSKQYAQQLNKGMDYSALRPVHFIGILDFILFPESEEVQTQHLILNAKTQENYFKDFNFILIELPKFHQALVELKNNWERWIWFIANTVELENKPKELLKNPAIEDALELAEESQWTKQELNVLLKREFFLTDMKYNLQKKKEIEEKLKVAKEEGKNENQRDVAKKMLSDGLSIEIISKYTGLSVTEIKQIQQ